VKIKTGTGKPLFRLGMCDVEDMEQNMRMLQQLHDMLDNPVVSDDPDAVDANAGTILVPFETVAGFDGSRISAGALVLDPDGTPVAAGTTVSLYDPLYLWDGAASGEQGVGSLINHPSSGDQVLLMISVRDGGSGGGGGTDTYKVKVTSGDSIEDFLDAQFSSDGGYGTGVDASNNEMDTATHQAVEFLNDDNLMYARVPLIKVNIDDPSPSYLEDAFTNDDYSSTLDGFSGGPWKQVFFVTSGDDDTMWAYTQGVDIEYGDLDISGGCGITAENGTISVDTEALVGQGLVESGACAIDVNLGCGLKFDEDGAVALNVAEIVSFSDGLTAYSSCGFAVTPYTGGCGIDVDGYSISVDAEVLAGAGLIESGSCGLAVNDGCGIRIVDDEVRIDPSDFSQDTHAGTIKVCDETIANLGDHIYYYLINNPTVIIQVLESVLEDVEVVTDCERLEVADGQLQLTLKTKTIKTLPDGSTSGGTTDPCGVDVATECP
jgi:hypothetical protein